MVAILDFGEGYKSCLYTYLKIGYRRERGLAIVERRLYDRKELWVLNIDGK